jgi:hypothetical protein
VDTDTVALRPQSGDDCANLVSLLLGALPEAEFFRREAVERRVRDVRTVLTPDQLANLGKTDFLVEKTDDEVAPFLAFRPALAPRPPRRRAASLACSRFTSTTFKFLQPGFVDRERGEVAGLPSSIRSMKASRIPQAWAAGAIASVIAACQLSPADLAGLLGGPQPGPSGQQTQAPGDTQSPRPTAQPAATDRPAIAPPAATDRPAIAPTPLPPGPAAVTLTVEPVNAIGVGAPVRIRIKVEGGDAVTGFTAQVSSLAEPGGETIPVNAAQDGTYQADLQLERPFDEGGRAVAIQNNGRLAVYAEGGVPNDSITVKVGDQTAYVLYEEPPSTVTGVIRVGGVAVGGAQLMLKRPDTLSKRTASRSDGSYAFHDVAPGTYHLIAGKNGARHKTQIVTVP